MGGGGMTDQIASSTAENPRVNQMGQAFMEPGWMEPEAIADAVAFLVSPASANITSEHLSVDQGMQYFSAVRSARSADHHRRQRVPR